MKLQGHHSDTRLWEANNVKSTVHDLRSRFFAWVSKKQQQQQVNQQRYVVHVEESLASKATDVSADNYPQYYGQNLTIP